MGALGWRQKWQEKVGGSAVEEDPSREARWSFCSKPEEEMKQWEYLEVKANTSLGCFSCLNQECSLRGGTQKSDRCTGKQVPSTAPQVVGGAPQRANPGPACGHFELNSGSPVSAALPVSREVCPWEARSGKFPQKWQHDAFWGSASATESGM